jgi:hypothetical protein
MTDLSYRAHKVVLAAASDLFYDLFTQNDSKVVTKVGLLVM